MKKKIIYEQPLNDHIRNLLRLEYLFEGLNYYIKGASQWDSRAAINYFVEIIEFISRLDIKTQLTSDLEHYVQGLERWQRMPNVDKERLSQLLDKLRTALVQLDQLADKPEREPLGYTLITTVKQRASIVGGTCPFDLPHYHHWLQKSIKQRQVELNEWLIPLVSLQEAVELDLYMIRNNGETSQQVAMEGFFQSQLDASIAYQIVRVSLPFDHSCYPEISGGKHRFTIRFFEQHQVEERPLQTEQDINFELCCCMI